MNKHDLHIFANDKNEKITKDMCGSCIHKSYCLLAYKKDHWCGNWTGNNSRKRK